MDSYGKPYDGHEDLEGKILTKMKASGTPDQVRQALKLGYAAALGDMVIIVDRKERKRLFASASRSLLEEVIDGLEPDEK